MSGDDTPQPRALDRQDADILASLERRWAAGEISDAVYLKRRAVVLGNFTVPSAPRGAARRPWDPPAPPPVAPSPD